MGNYHHLRFSSKISAVNNIFGLENGEKCKRGDECIAGRCECEDLELFSKGSCREPSDSDSACAIPFVMFIGPLFLIEGTLILLICYNLYERYRLKRKGLIKEKSNSLKHFTIAGSIIGAFLLFFFIYKTIS